MCADQPRVKVLFGAAIEIEASAERAAYLDEMCGDDVALRSRVDQLLEVHDQGDGYLNVPPTVATTKTTNPPFTEGPGTVIDDYRLLQVIGQGGFGVVYLAEPQKPGMGKVALKIIKPGMDTRQVIARFETERQAVAMMDHPNVAKVFDAGSTESGRPYFVMELVDGRSFTDYCDGCRVAIHERLRLFVAVCSAIDHAHNRGVIHRDIKPSNILVAPRAGEPTPKVIDFGIAKATDRSLGDDAVVTMTGQFIGTPQYMSPEQADLSPLEIGPRTDIYSLGVLLYELLTGTTPFDAGELLSVGLDEMRRIMRDVPPTKPSARLRSLDDTVVEAASKRDTDAQTLNRLVAGDLDWITLKALEKDPTSRYATARELADDIQRHLEGRPILARRPTLAGRLTKWSQRHKAITAVLALVLLISAVASSVSNLYIREARDQALNREAEAAKQKVETEKQLLIATSMRLAAQSQSTRDETPIQSLLLAVEAIQVTRRRGEGVRPPARESLLGALSAIGGRPLMGEDIPIAPFGPVFSPDGRWMATNSGGEVRLWDLTEPWGSEVILRGQEAIARVEAVSSGGRWIVTTGVGEEAREFRLWCLTDADPLTVLRGHEDRVGGAQFSPDGRWLATSSHDKRVRVWDLRAEDLGISVRLLPGDETLPRSPAFSPDGRWLATTLGGEGNARARLWELDARDLHENSILLPMREHEVHVTVAFSPDGRWLATGSSVYEADRSTAVKLWDLAAESPAASPIELPGDTVEIEKVAFTPDGRWLVSAGLDSTAQLWDATSDDPAATQVTLRGHVWGIWDVAISPDSRWLVTASADKTARVWNLTADDPSAASMVLRGHESRVYKAAFTPDGNQVITWDTACTARTWNVAPGTFGLTTTGGLANKTFALPTTPQLLWQQPPVRRVWKIADGGKFLTCDYRGIGTLWDMSTPDAWNSALRFATPKAPGAEFASGRPRPSRDGRWVWCVTKEGTYLWDVRAQDAASPRKLPGSRGSGRGMDGLTGDGRWLFQASFGEHVPLPGWYRIAGSRDGRWLTAPNWDCSITLWDLHADSSSSAPIVLRGENQGPAPKFNDQRVWDLKAVDPTAEPLVMGGFQGDVTMVGFSPDGHWLATASKDGTVRLWSMQSDDPASQPYVLQGEDSEVIEVWFSPNSRWLASRHRSDERQSVYLWDLSDVQFHTRPFLLPGQAFARQFPVEQSPYSHDSKWLLTITADGPARLWDLTAEDPTVGPIVLRGHVGTTLATAFSRDGRWLATGGARVMRNQSLIKDETVRLWDLSAPAMGIGCVVLRGYASRCAAVTFTADSHHLVTRCADGEVRVWELRLGKLIQLARQTAGRQLTQEEREKYLLPAIPASE